MNPQPDNEPDNDDTPDEIILEGIKEGLKQAINGQTIPLSQMWEGIDVQDAESYQQPLDKIELLESLAGIRKSLEEFEQGKGIPLNQALAEFQ